METLLSYSLLSGPVPTAIALLAGPGTIWLLLVRRRWYLIAVPAAVVVSVTATLGLHAFVEKVWHPFADPVEAPVYAAIAVAFFGVAMVIPRVIAARRRILASLVSVVSAAAVVAAGAVQVNAVFAAYPTVGTALGASGVEQVALSAVGGHDADVVTGHPLESAWHAPAGLPSDGRILTAVIPGSTSGFTARAAEIYLPPAYFAKPRPLLPVLVLLAGQPGSPQDWLDGGQLVPTADGFARHHHGLAPVVVVADGTGSQLANPLCMDSRLGNVATYLATDVPRWVTTNLQIDPDPQAWAVGGLSYGGTCALQLAANYPKIYPTFLDMSGQDEPTLGDRQHTIEAAFNGDVAAFTRVNPLDLLRSRRYPTSAGAFVVGDDDEHYRPQVETMFRAARVAGMNVHLDLVPGGHSFTVWSTGLRSQFDWLAKRFSLTT